MDPPRFNDPSRNQNTLPEHLTPVKINRAVLVAGKYRNVPISLDEAIARSAGRAKVFSNGRQVFETTSIQESLKFEYGIDFQPTPKLKENYLEKSQVKKILPKITENKQTKTVFHTCVKDYGRKALKSEVKGKKLQFNK